MSRPILTAFQKYSRKMARKWGAFARHEINFAIHPVFEGDEVIHTRAAYDAARKAFGYAAASLYRIKPNEEPKP